jgi:hypothetical protein
MHCRGGVERLLFVPLRAPLVIAIVEVWSPPEEVVAVVESLPAARSRERVFPGRCERFDARKAEGGV